jgi:hypothetical protein
MSRSAQELMWGLMAGGFGAMALGVLTYAHDDGLQPRND